MEFYCWLSINLNDQKPLVDAYLKFCSRNTCWISVLGSRVHWCHLIRFSHITAENQTLPFKMYLSISYSEKHENNFRQLLWKFRNADYLYPNCVIWLQQNGTRDVMKCFIEGLILLCMFPTLGEDVVILVFVNKENVWLEECFFLYMG